MSRLTRAAELEALLLSRGSLTTKDVASALGIPPREVTVVVAELRELLDGHGMRPVEASGRVSLGTAPEAHALVEKLRREELEGPVGRAGLETLSIIIYQGPLTRADIEYVRGVNVSSALRTLLIRGLIERTDNPSDKRSFLYQGTPELAAYLGVTQFAELPDYESFRTALTSVYEERDAAEKAEKPL